MSWRGLEGVFKTSSERFEDVLKTLCFWRLLEEVLARSLEDVLKTSWRHLENDLKTSWRCLEDVFCKASWRRFCETSWRCLENVLKTSWRRMTKTNILVLTKTSWRRLEDVFWRRMTKANIFVLIKTSWRCLEDVFWRRRRKTSLRRLHRDECLLRYFIGNNEACRRMGEASKIPLNWERVLSLSLCHWFKAIAESQNTPREYVLFKSTPDDMYNDGTKGFSESVSRVFGKT